MSLLFKAAILGTGDPIEMLRTSLTGQEIMALHVACKALHSTYQSITASVPYAGGVLEDGTIFRGAWPCS